MKWFRFYHDDLDDPRVQRLSGDEFKVWVNLSCLASRREERGTLPDDMDEIAFALRIGVDEAKSAVAALLSAGLLERDERGLRVTGWAERQYESDDVTKRTRRHKAKKAVVPDETLTSTGKSGVGTFPVTPEGTFFPSARADTDADSDQSQRRLRREETQTRGDTHVQQIRQETSSCPPDIGAIDRLTAAESKSAENGGVQQANKRRATTTEPAGIADHAGSAPPPSPDTPATGHKRPPKTPIPSSFLPGDASREYARGRGLADRSIDELASIFVSRYQKSGEAKWDWHAAFDAFVVQALEARRLSLAAERR
jgi:hypothetical protein